MSRVTAKHVSIVTGTLLTVFAIGWWLLEFAPGTPDAAAPGAGAGEAAASPVAKAVRVAASKARRARSEPGSAPAAVASEVPAGPTAMLTVRVVSSGTHEALGGAHVEVTDADGADWTCECDAAGFARFETLPAGAVEIRARTGDGIEVDRSLVLAAKAAETVEIALDPAAVIEGIVVDAKDGAPVAAAEVEAFERSDAGDRSLADSTSDDAGRFRFSPIPKGTAVIVRASHAGFARGEATVAVPATGGATGRVEVRMNRTGTMRGVVHDPEGRPAPGAYVRIASESAGARAAQFAVCGRDGAYVLRDVPIGEPLRVVAQARGWGDSAAFSLHLTDDAPDPAQDLRLRRPATVAIRVTRPDGAADARAWAEFDDDESAAWESDAGWIERDGLTPGTHSVRVRARGLATAVREIAAAEGERVSIEVALDRGCTIAGIVVDPQGEPLGGVHVFASPELPRDSAANARREWSEASATNGSGAFAVTGLARGRYELFVFAGESPGLVVHERDGSRTAVAAPCGDARLVAATQALVTLRVTLPPGAVRPAEVLVTQMFWVFHGMAPDVEHGESVAIDSGAWTREGVIRCSVEPGAVQLRVRVPGFAADTVSIPPRELGAAADLGEMRAGPGRTLHCRVADAAALPVAGAVITTTEDDSTSAPVRTKSDGTFVVEHLGPATFVVRAETAGLYGTRKLTSADDATAATIVVRRKGVLRGRVVGADGAPLAGASLTIFHGSAGGDDSGRTTPATTDAAGAFSVDVASGSCSGLVTIAGKPVGFGADVPEGGEASVRVVAK